MEGKLDFITSERDPERSTPWPSTLGVLLCLYWGHEAVSCPASATIKAPVAGCRSCESSQFGSCYASGFGTPTYPCTLKEEFFLLRALLNFFTEGKDQPFLYFSALGKKSRMQTHNHRVTFYQGTLEQVGQLQDPSSL